MALSCKAPSMRMRSQAVAARRPARVQVKAVSELSSFVAVGGSTIAFLSLGRFVFLPYQRRQADFQTVSPSSSPKTGGGTTFFDKLQQPASFTTTSKDPAGFTIVDVMGWGALGHAFGFFLLAASSLNAAGVSPFPR